jgi:hypothetical protein
MMLLCYHATVLNSAISNILLLFFLFFKVSTLFKSFDPSWPKNTCSATASTVFPTPEMERILKRGNVASEKPFPWFEQRLRRLHRSSRRRDGGENKRGMYLRAFMHNINPGLMVASETRPYAPWPLPLFRWTEVIKAIYICRKGSRWHALSLPKVLTALKKVAETKWWLEEKEVKERERCMKKEEIYRKEDNT